MSFDFSAIQISDGGIVPAGMYRGRFVGPEHLPEQEPDGMTGKGGRKYAKFRFSFEITSDGPHKGKTIAVETPVSTGPKSKFAQVCGWLAGRTLNPGEKPNITSHVGKEYGLTHAANPRGWTEVVHAMPVA